ncbi:hypothetical protein GCM10011360_18630 [Primorskyibacter flagellatus]|uniref:Sulfotransferase family protein n=1 Tax=Primorskyibacter flagellatus TaxID=1387277 RepID=A0A917A6D7_9RHOB|nr:sulfotransferase [Primorskyibacter flagellatus]GGE30908.1 hypothetical protein GCM10011360_18630 [Primorskyibacter flagellatus]
MTPRLRVVNLGLPKSGTTTLGRALGRAGLKTVDNRVHHDMTEKEEINGLFVGHLMYTDYYTSGDPLAQLEEFDAFGEISVLQDGNSCWPQMDFGLIEAIRTHHPGVKFVASWRDAAKLAESMKNWKNMVARLKRNVVPGLPTGFGRPEGQRIRWIEAHYAFLDRIFAGDPTYLRLDMAAPDAPAQLGRHIGRDIPWWGQANRNRKAGVAGDDAEPTDAA